MGNSKKPEGFVSKGERNRVGKVNLESYMQRTGHSTQASAVARRKNAIQRDGLAAAERIRDRVVKERNASRAEAVEANAQLVSACGQIH